MATELRFLTITEVVLGKMKLSEIQDCVWFPGSGRWRRISMSVSFYDKFNRFAPVSGMIRNIVDNEEFQVMSM